MPRRKPKHTLLSAGASLIGMGLIFLLLPAMLGTRPVMKAVGVNWGQIKIYGNCGQIKIYKQALSLHLIATSLIAVRAYQSSATAIFDYSS